MNDGGETRNLEGDTVNNSPKEFLHLVHNSKSEQVKDVRPSDVENIIDLPLKASEVG